MPEIVQQVAPIGGARAVDHGGVASRPMIDQSVDSTGIARSEGSGRPVIEQTVSSGGAGGSLLSEKTREMLANLDKHGTVTPPPAPETVLEDAAKPAPAAAAEPAAPAADTAAVTPPAATPTPDPVNERLTARNAELLAEVESLKKQPRGEPSARTNRLEEAERIYPDDPAKALRMFLAVVHDVEDPASKDIDVELRGLYGELTERELGVEADPATKAQRETARTRLMMKRDKRESQTAPQPAPAPSTDPSPEHIQLVGSHLTPIAAEYPYLMAASPALAGMRPEQVVLARIHHGFATGEYDRKTSDVELIKLAAKDLETRYQALADTFGKARPATSTATPTPATETAKQDAGQRQAARPITNASASVAPATPPAKQPATQATDDYRAQRPGETEHQRRLRIARHHIPD